MYRLLIITLFLCGMLSVSDSDDSIKTIFLRYATISNKNLESFIREKVICTAQTVWPDLHDRISYELDIRSDDSLYIFATYWGDFQNVSRGYFSDNDKENPYATKIDNRIIIIKAPSDSCFITPTSKKISIVEPDGLLGINDETILWFIRFDGDEISEVEFDCEYSYEIIEKLPPSLYLLPNVTIKKIPYSIPDFANTYRKLMPPCEIVIIGRGY